jgi:glucose-1-phosphate cytidylyltransferase
MKAVMLAGGLGTRNSEETSIKPKPIGEIDGRPILWHILKIFRMRMSSMEVPHEKAEPWEITLVDTGETSMTGGRLKQVRSYVRDEAFCFTYSNGVADVDITAQIAHHKTYGRLGTVTAVEPPGRYGAVQLGENAAVSRFQEKSQW